MCEIERSHTIILHLYDWQKMLFAWEMVILSIKEAVNYKIKSTETRDKDLSERTFEKKKHVNNKSIKVYTA